MLGLPGKLVIQDILRVHKRTKQIEANAPETHDTVYHSGQREFLVQAGTKCRGQWEYCISNILAATLKKQRPALESHTHRDPNTSLSKVN